MRLADRILAICSAAVFAALSTLALGSTDAHAARQTEARPKATSTKPPAPRVSLPAPKRKAAVVSSGKPRAGTAITTKARNAKTSKARLSRSRAASSVAVSHWGGISCVPFARAATGMQVKGNAHAWWQSAAGTYERGQRPEAGSVLNFRAISRMRLGHVAVVAQVIDSRTIEIDHANWGGPGGGGKGRVARGVPVIDVSPANDWSAVQVGLPGGGFGSVYPTYGFIYDRPDRGVMVANTLARPTTGQGTRRLTEVAEARTPRVMPAGTMTLSVDAPQRSLR
jgi:surface antigen